MLFWVIIEVAGDGLFLDVVEFSVFFQCSVCSNIKQMGGHPMALEEELS